VELAAGSRWRSVVDATEVVVVRPPKVAVDLECGGHPMVPLGAEVGVGAALDERHGGGSQLGKRYVDEASAIEVLCTKAGEGALSVSGRPLVVKTPKPLPSSD
jgi:hypothetical protein